MTKDNDIAFWDILNDKVFYPRLDGLLGCLGLSGDSLKYPASVLSCSLFLVFMPICFLALSRPRKEDHIHTRATLRALLTVIVPTCSLWPSRYIELARVLRSRVDIPLEVIIEDTIGGVIEFRKPIDDLADLICSGAIVNGNTICINIGWKWWISCFEWWMFAQGTPTGQSKSGYSLLHSPGYMFGLSDWLHNNMPTANSIPLGLSLSPFALASSALHPLLCLDCLPHGITPSLNAGCKVTLEFTAFSPSLRILSTAQIISAIPFIISEHPRRRPRSLVSVIKQLSASYGPNLVVDSLSNVSADYEHALRHVYKSLSGEQKIREMWAKILGIKAWRRDMFLVALEAALVRRGWIERWAVQVTAK
ncbi:hypothetical protein J3R83DRAFT_2176 [Lanmaoa asiatica]|nr:hypothetical protein J3R83DRAFT_2176 [Lanmaoa asiatica]